MGLNDGAFLVLASVRLLAWVVVGSLLVKVMTILGGIIVQVPILVPEQVEPVISRTTGTVIVIVPDGESAGSM